MKTGQIVYLDCDEVLLKTAETHAVFLHQTYNLQVNASKYPSQWNFNGIVNLNFNESTRLFIASEYFANIPPIDKAQEAIELLKSNRFILSVITSISDEKHAKIARIQNLNRVFGRNTFDTVNFLPLGWDNKAQFFQNSQYGIAVDDSIFNVQDAIRSGHKGVFITIKQNVDWHDHAKNNKIMTATSLFDATEKIIR